MNTKLAEEDILLRIIGITNNNIKKICKINKINYEETIEYMKNFKTYVIEHRKEIVKNLIPKMHNLLLSLSKKNSK